MNKAYGTVLFTLLFSAISYLILDAKCNEQRKLIDGLIENDERQAALILTLTRKQNRQREDFEKVDAATAELLGKHTDWLNDQSKWNSAVETWLAKLLSR